MTSDTRNNTTSKAVESTLKALGVAPSFFYDLLTKGDDWTFVIKSHALLEVALTHLLVSELERPQLADVLATIETSNTRTGKLAFVKALILLEEHHRRLIRSLSELRNGLVHDVRNTSFSFSEPLFSLGSRQTKEIQQKAAKCVNHASAFFKESFELAGKRLTRKQFAKENPRLVIYYAIFFTLASIYDEIEAEDPLVRALMKAQRRQSNPSIRPAGREQPTTD